MPSGASDTFVSSSVVSVDEMREQELCALVPDLMETLNDAMGNVNLLQRQVAEKQEQLREAEDKFRLLEAELDCQSGEAVIVARPYFDADQRLRKAAWERDESHVLLQDAELKLREVEMCLRNVDNSENMKYGAHNLKLDTRASLFLFSVLSQVVLARLERDQCAKQDSEAVIELDTAYAAKVQAKKEIGSDVIRRAEPFFSLLRDQCDEISALKEQIQDILEHLQCVKDQHKETMLELEFINISVHRMRTGDSLPVPPSRSCSSSPRPRRRRTYSQSFKSSQSFNKSSFSGFNRSCVTAPSEVGQKPVAVSRARRMRKTITTLYRRTRWKRAKLFPNIVAKELGVTNPVCPFSGVNFGMVHCL